MRSRTVCRWPPNHGGRGRKVAFTGYVTATAYGPRRGRAPAAARRQPRRACVSSETCDLAGAGNLICADREVEQEAKRCAVYQPDPYQVVAACSVRLNHPTGHATATAAKGMVHRRGPARRDGTVQPR